MTAPLGQGDITNPNAWTDLAGNIPPKAWNAVPSITNYPLNGDGRYWFSANATTPNPTASPIHFIGLAADYIGSAGLQYSILTVPTDGSVLNIGYALDGVTFTNIQISPAAQSKGLVSGMIPVALTGGTILTVKVFATGGAATPGTPLGIVAIAITRNINEQIPWDYSNPFNPVNYNAQRLDLAGFPSATLAALRTRIMIRLGFSNNAASPPPGMAALVNDFLSSGQAYLFRRYPALQTRHFFRWQVNPGQRFYSLKDNDEDVIGAFRLDPAKTIEYVGIQDTRNVWYPLIEGISPMLYTMLDKPWRPARYNIGQAIEIYPAPDQTYWLWIRANFGLMAFAADADTTTLDSELVFLTALANAKAHYGQADANNIQAQANAYRGELIAGTHKTARYVPGTIQVPPAVRPTLISFNG